MLKMRSGQDAGEGENAGHLGPIIDTEILKTMRVPVVLTGEEAQNLLVMLDQIGVQTIGGMMKHVRLFQKLQGGIQTSLQKMQVESITPARQQPLISGPGEDVDETSKDQ